MTALTLVAVGTAAIGSAVVGGVLGAFSGFVMPALARLPEAGGAAAMRSINVTAVRPPLMIALFGTAAAAIAAAAAALTGGTTGAAAVLPVVAGVCYFGGVVGVTAAANVPLNNRLAAQRPGTPADARCWTRYRRSWTRWNHVRTAAALAAAVAYTVSLVL